MTGQEVWERVAVESGTRIRVAAISGQRAYHWR